MTHNALFQGLLHYMVYVFILKILLISKKHKDFITIVKQIPSGLLINNEFKQLEV